MFTPFPPLNHHAYLWDSNRLDAWDSIYTASHHSPVDCVQVNTDTNDPGIGENALEGQGGVGMHRVPNSMFTWSWVFWGCCRFLLGMSSCTCDLDIM